MPDVQDFQSPTIDSAVRTITGIVRMLVSQPDLLQTRLSERSNVCAVFVSVSRSDFESLNQDRRTLRSLEHVARAFSEKCGRVLQLEIAPL